MERAEGVGATRAHGGRAVRAPVKRTPPGTEQRPRRVPIVQGHMVPTSGERYPECAKYGDCLTAHTQAHPRSDPPCSCPAPCPWFTPNGERATDYAVSKTGNMEVT